MKLDYGTIIVIVVVLLFYLRLIGVQYGKARRYRIQSAKQADLAKQGKKAKAVSAPTYALHVTNWWLVGAGVVLIAGGAAMATLLTAGFWLQTLWWIPACVGIGLFTFSFK